MTGPREATELERLVGWFDARTGMARVVRSGLRKVFPDHWTFLLGELALFCFVILVLTGTFLTFFYVPSTSQVVYDGPYEPLHGEQVSAAYDSVLQLSFEVKAGLLMRQIHHWTALIFVGIVVVHLSRVFFTGAFRRPREINWLVGFTLLTLVLAMGVTGYTLPDDLLSGTGARIIYSAALSIPFVGPWVASLLFGGEFPTAAFISRFLVLHIMLLPALVVGLITVHIAFVVLHKHTQYRGGAAREDNVVGRNFWPGQVFRSTGLFFLTAAVVSLIGGFFQINPIWVYGPFDASVVSSPAQPDWYVGWLDGALRVFPPFEPTLLGVTVPSPFIPGVVIPGAVLTLVALWPFIEARLTRDRDEHHILDRWWEHPVRTATGVAILAFFGILTLAGGNDVLAFYFGAEVETLTLLFRALAVILPVLAWLVTWRVCRLRAAGGGPGPPPSRRRGPPPHRRRRVRGGRSVRSTARRGRWSRHAAASLALAGAVVAGGCLPRPVTAEGRQIADLYTAFTAIAAVVAAVVFGLATWSVIRYRGRPADGLPSQVHGSLRVELVWTAIPIVIIFGLFAVTLGVLTRVEAVTAAPRAEVRVEAYRWGWRASYPGTPVVVTGLREPGPTIVVPVGEPIRVTLASADVVHAFYVPLFLFKRDAIPGRDSVFEITIAEPGDYGGQCAEFCGIYHARMPFTIRAVERADYDAWLASQAAASPSPPPALPSPSQSPVSS